MKTIKITCDGTDYVDFKSLVPLQGDLKTLSEENLGKLKKSIIKYGFTAPGFVWKSGKKKYVMDMHQRIKALESLFAEGYTIPDVPIVYIQAKNKVEAKEKLLHISSQYGEFDRGSLDAFLLSINSDAELLETLRLVDEEMDMSFFDEPSIETTGDDEIPEDVETITKLGDLWELGNHRLLCGDSTDKETVEKLMDGQKADMVFTSPPYNQNLDKFKPSGMQKENPAWVKKMANAYNDSMPEDNYQKWQICLLDMYYEYTIEKASFFYNHKIRYRNKKILSPMEWLLKSKWNIRQEIIWNRKGSITLNARMFMPCDERIYWMTKKDFLFNDTTEIKSFSSVWDIPPKNEIKGVSAPFPNELPRRGIIACSIEGGIVIEPYCGSGTTLIACEKTNRICYGMELDTHYCDVIVQRYRNWCEDNDIEPIIKRNGKKQ